MPSSDPTFPVCLPPSSLEPPVYPSGPLPGSSHPTVLPGPAPWPLAHSLPGQLSSSPPPVRTQTKVDPSPTLPRSSRDSVLSGTETRGLLWVTHGFSNCAFPPKPLCVSGDDGKETSQPLPATRHTEPPGSACAFGLFSHVLFEKGVCGGRKCR